MAHITELLLLVAFLIALLNAAAQNEGRRHVWTVLWGAVAGFSAEWANVSFGQMYHYEFERFWLVIPGIPVPAFIGLGWGAIFYITTWTSRRLVWKENRRLDLWQNTRNALDTAFAAGILAVNLDLSIDPTAATMNGFWVWHGATHDVTFPIDMGFFGVPFDNFIAWLAMIAAYSFFTNAVFSAWEKIPWLARHRIYRDFSTPALGGALAAGVFALVSRYVKDLYLIIGEVISGIAHSISLLDGGSGNISNSLGQAAIFTVLFLWGVGLFARNIVKAPRDLPANWVVIGLVIFLHGLSAVLFVVGVWIKRADSVSFTAIGVMIPINALLGFVAFAWPSIDSIFTRGRNDQSRAIFREQTLESYSGDSVRALVATPKSEADLEAVLAYVTAKKSKVTFRGAGHAFDTQSLNADVVISLKEFTAIELDADKRLVKVGCAATWGRILEETLPAGLVPHIMITARQASAGGTLAANALSRFSPSYGREGKHVESFRLVTPAGKAFTCSRDENKELFEAVIGGLGYVGAVVECTHRLLKVEPNARVKSDVRIYSDLGRIDDAITEHAPKLARELKARKVARQASEQPGTASSAALYMKGGIRGLVVDSTYVSGDMPLKPSPFHTPKSLSHRLLQFFALIPLFRNIGFFITYHWAFNEKVKTFVDEAHGYSFFEDGNVFIRDLLKLFGLPVPIIQQTYILPDGDDDEPQRQEFFTEVGKILARWHVEPTLVDMLYLPADDENDDFLLSSSHRMPGFAVTFTFESMYRKLTREQKALEEISEVCARLGGRLHLVKNVRARPETIQKMYAERIERMKKIRQAHGGAIVHNEFAERVLDGI